MREWGGREREHKNKKGGRREIHPRSRLKNYVLRAKKLAILRRPRLMGLLIGDGRLDWSPTRISY